MQEHILKTTTEIKEARVIIAVSFSKEIRIFICMTAKSLLSELVVKNFKSVEEFAKTYDAIQGVFGVFDYCESINTKYIKNAIRVLDLRITHCADSIKNGDWKESEQLGCPDFGILENPSAKIFVKNHEGIINRFYNECTMEAMLATRQILIDSLITLTPEFE